MAWPRKKTIVLLIRQTVIMVVVNDKFEILNEENWYPQQLMNTTSNNKNNKKKLCSTQRHISPVIKRKWRVENILAFLQLDKLVNLSNYKTIIYFSKWFFASLERKLKLDKYSRPPITGTFKGNRKEFELSGVWSK